MVNLKEAALLYTSGESLSKIGLRYGVSRQRVFQVISAGRIALHGHLRKQRKCAGCSKLLTGAVGKKRNWHKWCSEECKKAHLESLQRERLYSRIHKTRGCWIWKGSLHRTGYGTTWWRGKHDYAHRVIWDAFVGSIPQGKHVLHSCDNPRCVRPSHLFLGTQLDNNADRDEKGRTGIPEIRLRSATFARARTSKTALTFGRDFC